MPRRDSFDRDHQPVRTTTPQAVDPWFVDLVVVVGGSFSAGERRALSRDVERGTRLRLGSGVYVDRGEFESLDPSAQHIVRMRAVAAASPAPIVFSHWSAAVLHGLPVLRPRLYRVHVTIPEPDERHRVGIAHHVFGTVEQEVVQRHGLLLTDMGRTVVDIAGAAPLEEGVIAADRVLQQGLPRALLEAAVDLAGPRRAARRIVETVAFAHPGGESPAESRTRVTAYRIGVEVPELQHEIRLDGGGAVFTDTWFPLADAVLEVDGDSKYLDSSMAPGGAGRVVLAEKRREDEVRSRVRAFARCGWAHSGSVVLLRPVLHRIGVDPTRPRTPFAEYCAVARAARPRPRSR